MAHAESDLPSERYEPDTDETGQEAKSVKSWFYP